MQTQAVKSLGKELVGLGVHDEEADVLALYALVLGLKNVSVLDGTTQEERMRGDLEGMGKVGEWIDGHGQQKWEELLGAFKGIIGEDKG